MKIRKVRKSLKPAETPDNPTLTPTDTVSPDTHKNSASWNTADWHGFATAAEGRWRGRRSGSS